MKVNPQLNAVVRSAKKAMLFFCQKPDSYGHGIVAGHHLALSAMMGDGHEVYRLKLLFNKIHQYGLKAAAQ